MATYVDVFVTQNVATIHRLFGELMAEAEAVDRRSIALGGGPRSVATRAEIAKVYGQVRRELDELARRTSLQATQRIRFYFQRSARRPPTGIGGVHLRDLFRCRPLPRIAGFPTGSVGIADVDVLNRAVDPLYPDAGEYWRAQEYGTTHQAGRQVRGFFYGPGFTNATRPIGGHPGDQPLFVPSSILQGPRGDRRGGLMTIGREIAPRHFIRDGSAAALANWRAGMRQIDQGAARQLKAIRSATVPGAARRRGARTLTDLERRRPRL